MEGTPDRVTEGFDPGMDPAEARVIDTGRPAPEAPAEHTHDPENQVP